MRCLRNGSTKKEPELARHLPPQVFPEATSVIQNTLHHKCRYHQQSPLKRKTKPEKKANSPRSVKTEVGLSLEIRILRKRIPGVALTRKQSKDVVLNHDATRDKHSDLLKYSELMIIAADIYWACTVCPALCWVVCLIYSWGFTDPTLSGTTLMEKSEISSCFFHLRRMFIGEWTRESAWHCPEWNHCI